jgi:2-polyprenyl-6-hydroxyphenyl methylase/3-demethylubiquinone-9 3-methyltransferase
MNTGDDAVGDVRRRERFPFGANWADFLDGVEVRQIEESKYALQQMLGLSDLGGRSFLDVGCGSGLHSLAARMLGCHVVSFDFDPKSVECAVRLHKQVDADQQEWRVLHGSVLDQQFLAKLGSFDIVYSWGVLHHTGSMWDAIENVAASVSEGGILFIAIYNDQGGLSRYWKSVKVLYNRNGVFRWLLIAAHFPYLILGRMIAHAWRGDLSIGRGMSYWTDMKDWLGGLPFEVAQPGAIVDFLHRRGFNLEKLKTCGRRPGCNEYVLRKRCAWRRGDHAGNLMCSQRGDCGDD